MTACQRLCLLLAALAATSLLLPGLATAQTACDELSEDWFGVWRTTIEMRDCELGTLVFQAENEDTICADDCFDAGNEEGCTTVVEGNSVTFDCQTVEPIVDDCTLSSDFTATYTRDGTSMSGSGRVIATYSESCPIQFVGFCNDVEFSAERISGPAACFVPTLVRDWTGLKAMFR